MFLNKYFFWYQKRKREITHLSEYFCVSFVLLVCFQILEIGPYYFSLIFFCVDDTNIAYNTELFVLAEHASMNCGRKIPMFMCSAYSIKVKWSVWFDRVVWILLRKLKPLGFQFFWLFSLTFDSIQLYLEYRKIAIASSMPFKTITFINTFTLWKNENKDLHTHTFIYIVCKACKEFITHLFVFF